MAPSELVTVPVVAAVLYPKSVLTLVDFAVLASTSVWIVARPDGVTTLRPSVPASTSAKVAISTIPDTEVEAADSSPEFVLDVFPRRVTCASVSALVFALFSYAVLISASLWSAVAFASMPSSLVLSAPV